MANVVFTEPAEYDLLDIEHYIFTEIGNPQAAECITDGILNVVENLKEFPMKHPLLKDKFLRSRRLRMTHFDNYNIFYHYVSNNDTVYIIRILYNRIDWQDRL